MVFTTSSWTAAWPTAATQAREQRHLLLPALQAVQARCGWISHGALNYICERLTVPPADAFGVATFYGLLSVNPRPPRVLHVCEDIACKCVGSDALIAALEEQFGPEETERDGAAWLRSPCLGQCDRGPAAMLTVAGAEPIERVLGEVGCEQALSVLRGEPTESVADAPVRQRGEAGLRLLGRIGVVDPASLHDYRAAGGYEALRRAVEMGPQAVIREVKDSGLMGRGGAAFPTGVKWEAVAQQPVRPHYLICNADESEPGTFKDRPAAGRRSVRDDRGDDDRRLCDRLRARLPVSARGVPGRPRAHQPCDRVARHHGYLGPDILDRGFAFEIEIRSGAGAYICGEETAIFNSIEGYRGEPRAKPPFPVARRAVRQADSGQQRRDALQRAAVCCSRAAPAFARIGTEKSTGTKLFCVSGHVGAPGVYEVEFGTTLGELLERAGGVPGGRALQAVLLGGAAGAFVGPDQLDLPLTMEGARAAGATLGLRRRHRLRRHG